MNIKQFARMGGKARAAKMSAEERSSQARAAIQTHWDALTPEERSAQARKGANTRKRNAAAKAKAAKKGKRK